MSLQGVENITMPSFDARFEDLDEAGIRWDVDQAVAHGFSGTACACDAGLSPSEMRRFVEIVVDQAAGRLHVGVLAPTDSVAIARDLLVAAERAGAVQAVLGVPLTMAIADADALHDAFAELCSATGMDVVLPVGEEADLRAIHPSNVPVPVYDRLAERDNVVGLRVTTPDPAPLFEAFRRYAGRLEVGLGSPVQLGALEVLHRRFGARWLAPAHWELWQSPDRRYVVEHHELVTTGRGREAVERYWRLGPAMGIAMGAGLAMPDLAGMGHWPLAKYLSWSVGGNGGLTRHPAMNLKEHQVVARQAMLRAIGIEPREPHAEFLVGRAAATA